jgi:cystathionine beta-lyase
MLAFLSAGDHVLVPDSLYGSARAFVTKELVRYGVDVEFYEPTIGAGIERLMKPNTRMVYCESPGSLTFEMQDIPAIAKVAKARGALVVADNTWATPLLQKPFGMGVDISIHSCTKYIGGHSDLVMGAVLCKEPHFKVLNRAHRNLGAAPSGDSAYLALRGLRTIAVRLKQHGEHAIEVAKWLQEGVPDVKRILFPALPEDPGYGLWKRDMTGCSGLFAIELGPVSHAAVGAMLDGLKHFGMGFSWGGFESLVIAYEPAKARSVSQFDKGSIFLRLHIGLEAPKDLIADLDAGFARLRAAK